MGRLLKCPACQGIFEIRPGITAGRARVKCYDCSPQRLPKQNTATLKRLAAVASINSELPKHRKNCICLDCVRERESQRVRGGPSIAPAVSAQTTVAPSVVGDHERVVRAELAKLGWSDTMEGVGAVGLAMSLDDRDLPGAQRTSLLKQLRDVIADIRASAPREPDALDAWQDAARRKRDGAR